MVLILLKPSILLSLLRNNQDLEGGEPLLFIIHTDRHLPVGRGLFELIFLKLSLNLIKV